MLCPCCGSAMEKGCLQAGNLMLWAKRRHKLSLLPDAGEVMLAQNMVSGSCFDAYICKACQKIVLNYEGHDVTEG